MCVRGCVYELVVDAMLVEYITLTDVLIYTLRLCAPYRLCRGSVLNGCEMQLTYFTEVHVRRTSCRFTLQKITIFVCSSLVYCIIAMNWNALSIETDILCTEFNGLDKMLCKLSIWSVAYG